MATKESLRVGELERRQGYVELDAAFVDKLKEHVAKEDAVVKMIGIFGVLISVIMSILVWVFVEKNGDLKTVQNNIQSLQVQHGEILTTIRNQNEVLKKLGDR